MSLTNIENQILSYRQHLEKSLKYLEYSLEKISKLHHEINKLNFDQLETWESFTSRFARTTDIFLNKFLRAIILKADPLFRKGFRDILNESEKLQLISNGNRWWAIRELRNKEAHEYTDEDLQNFFIAVKNKSPFIIQEIKEAIKKSCE